MDLGPAAPTAKTPWPKTLPEQIAAVRTALTDLGTVTPATSATPATWVIPGRRMKAKRDHRIPLSARALDILQQAHGLSDGSDLVFPGTRHGKGLSDMTLSKLVKELGFNADIHGFRTSFWTWAQERTNFPREVAEAALAHATGDKVEAAYARSDVLDKRRKMMDAWAGYLAGESGKVVRIGA